jgi:hypothetical protein
MVHSARNLRPSAKASTPPEANVKKHSKPTPKPGRKGANHRRGQPPTRRQTELQARDQLLHEAQPLMTQYDLRSDNQEEWTKFASQVMFDSTALYDEIEFRDMVFDPAEVIYTVTRQFSASVPPPEELDKLPQAEREDIVSEVYINSAAEFVQPELVRGILDGLVNCRRRLKREKRTDQLALAGATEMLLRSDSRPVIWGTCGILQKMLHNALEEAFAFEKASKDALKAAQAIQPDVTNVYDLEEGSPADLAFWEMVDKTPDLADYLDRQLELEDEAVEIQHQLDSELAADLFDPEELREFLTALVEDLEAHNVEPSSDNALMPSEESVVNQALMERLPELIKTTFARERFEELVDDLDEIIEKGDEANPTIQRAEELSEALADDSTPYWENLALAQFIFNALVASVLEEADLFEDDEE